MIRTLPLHRRRILAAAILAGLVLLLWAALIAPAAGALHRALSARARPQLLLQAQEQDIKGEAAWQDAYAKLTAANAGSLFIREQNAALASARFQSDIKQSLEQHKARIASIQALPPAKEGDLARATVRATFTIPLKTLEALLTMLERKTPSVFLDNLIITAPPDGAADTDQAPLSVQCDFISYLLPGPAAKLAYSFAGVLVLAGLSLVALAHVTLAQRPTDAGGTPDAPAMAVSARSGTGTPPPDYSAISGQPIFVAARRMPPPAPEPVVAGRSDNGSFTIFGGHYD